MWPDRETSGGRLHFNLNKRGSQPRTESMVMRETRQAVHGFVAMVFAGVMTACAAGSDGPTAGGGFASHGADDNGGGSTAAVGSGAVRLRCEVRATRSKIS